MGTMIRRDPTTTTPARAYEPFPARWDPFHMMRDFMNWDPFVEMTPSLPAITRAFSPSFDVKETKDSYIFSADLPGIDEDDLDISLSGNRLTVSGKREEEARNEDDSYYAYERSYGSFTRSFTLPDGVNLDDVKADLKSGVLTLSVPKSAEHQARKISLRKMTDKVVDTVKSAFDKEKGASKPH